MPGPAAAVAPVAALAGLASAASIASAGADIVSLGFAIADHLKAQEGLKFNQHMFTLDPADDQQPLPQPASASTRPKAGEKSAGVPAPASQTAMLLVPTTKRDILEIKSNDERVRFGVDFYRRQASSGPSTLVSVVRLREANGFDSELTDQAELEFGGLQVDAGYLLSVKGFVNEWLSGFFHFYCDILIRWVPTGSQDKAILPLNSGLMGTGGDISKTENNGFLVTF